VCRGPLSSEQAPVGIGACDKRPHSPAQADQAEEGPRLNLATALPLSVWQEHIRPVLATVEAARLRSVCKALKASVREWPMRLKGPVSVLAAALTCFPATERFDNNAHNSLDPSEESRVVELLRGHGGTLKRVYMIAKEARRGLSSAVLARGPAQPQVLLLLPQGPPPPPDPVGRRATASRKCRPADR
jgi:hypothetical protein